MELKGYQQTVLDTFTLYLDTLKTGQTRANKIKQANAQEIDPDFIFALSHQDGYERLMVLETKGDHLDNSDTAYKKKLFDVCSESFRLETIKSAGKET